MKLFPILIVLFCSTFLSFSHPNHGKVLCFEATNFDVGVAFLNDRRGASFTFTNCSDDTVRIKNVTGYNQSKQTPYLWDRKLEQRPILPNQTDTLRFYRNHSHRTTGLYDQSFTIVFEDLDAKQYLNIFSELKHNRGHLEANPLVLDTVERGDTISFQLSIKNTGLDPIEISPRLYHQNNPLIYLDSFPMTIEPSGAADLKFLLYTNDICRNYKKHISFISNEETSRYRNTVNISYSGFLETQGEAGIKFDSLTKTKYVSSGEACVFNFPFINTGDVPLFIVYAKTSCGCLVASYPKEPIPPGGRAAIKVKYDSKRIGPINKSITVLSNACKEQTVLRVKGQVFLVKE